MENGNDPIPRRRLVEHAPNQPYLVAPGKPTVQKLPDFKMTSSQPSMLVGPNRTLADRRLLHHQPRRQDRGGDGGGGGQPWRPHRARRMRPLSALWRDPGSDAGRPPGDAGTGFARARPAGPAGRDAAGAARNALDCALAGPRGQDQRPARLGPARTPRARSLHHRLHDLAGNAGGDGGGDRQGRAPAAAQDQARRRRRRRRGSPRCARPRPNPN